jgi:hypothetical protein
MILHGIYDNGRIEILEKDLPNIRAEIEIQLPIEKAQKSDFNKALAIIDGYHGTITRWMREELHER